MADDDRRIDDTGSDRARPGTPVVQLGSPGRTPFVLAALTAAFLGVAIVKPWPAPSGPSVELAAPSPTPTIAPTLDPLAVVHRECQEPPGWRTYSKERWSGGTLHVWMTLEPVSGHHAPIEDLPTVPYASEVLGLGFCTPDVPAERPPDGAVVHVWRVDAADTSSPSAELVAIEPAIAGLELPYGALFLPPSSGSDPAPDRWASGRYAFQVVGPGNGYERWRAVQLDPPVHAFVSPSPDPAGQPLP